MRHLWLYSSAFAVLTGCIVEVNESKWPDGLEDTGAISDPGDEVDDEDLDFTVTPDELSPGMNEILTVTVDRDEDWSGLRSVIAIGDLEVVDSKSVGAELWVAVVVPDVAMEGPAHLIFEFDDGSVHVARDVLYISELGEDAPADTGLVDDEPTND